MLNKRSLFLALLTLAGTMHGISFRDYYYGQLPWQPGLKNTIDKQVKNERTLHISLLGLTDLDGLEEVPEIEKIKRLYVGSNQISQLPDIVRQMQDLEIIGLSNNKFVEVPGGVFNLPKLRIVWIDQNQLTTIPKAIGTMKGLEKLAIDRNFIQKLPDTMSNLTQLRELYASNNQIRNIPTFLGQLSNLTKITLSKNQIAALPDQKDLPTLNNLKKLELLTLFQNPIAMDEEQLQKALGLDIVQTRLLFKTPEQAKAENDLFAAIENAWQTPAFFGEVREDKPFAKAFKAVRNEKLVMTQRGYELSQPEYAKIDITKMRDKHGNNILHAIINASYQHMKPLRTEIKGIAENESLTKEQKAEKIKPLDEKLKAIDQTYTNLFGTVLQAVGYRNDDAQNLLLTPNSKNQDVLHAALFTLGPDSILVKTYLTQTLKKDVYTPTPEGTVRPLLKPFPILTRERNQPSTKENKRFEEEERIKAQHALELEEKVKHAK